MQNDGLVVRHGRKLLLAMAAVLVLAGGAGADPHAPRRLEAGRLETGDVLLPGGEYCDEYQLEGSAGELVILELHSTEYDAFVQMSPSDTSGPHGEKVWHNNDSQAGTHDARLAVTLPADGTYDIYVTSAAAEETGRYELSITVLPEPDRIEAGQLSEDDRALNTGEYCDYIDFTAKKGELWVIDLRSAHFDTYVFGRAVDDAEFKVDNDDLLEDTHHSQVVMSIPRDGEYFIGVTSAQAGETGDYELSLTATTSIAVAADDGGIGLIQQGAFDIGAVQSLSKLLTPGL